eukprot:comp11667_c0_seq1/m.6188 comp11667_c0_seq1/g.6188  ORF comp11667_c0_seq1/g.6188 comp11667_c0_seq1/m.6188 type:complete len:318 (-) comp11667_c0_seq1:362-1315(-)
MGQLFASLRKENKKEAVDLFLDFENAMPTEHEQEVYVYVADKLKDAQTVVGLLRNYEGASDAIRQAIANPKLEEETWAKVCPLIKQLKDVYDYSANLEAAVPKLLTALCSETPTAKSLDARQALTKQFAEIMHFVLTVDDLKMSNPAIQNDFSYYRRMVSRMKMGSGEQGQVVVKDDMANKMSLFYAYPTPFLNCTIGVVSNFAQQGGVPLDNITECFSVISEVCRGMVENQDAQSRFKNKDTITLCMRVMTGCIILYDHVQPTGAFSKKSTIDIRNAIRVLREHMPHTENLINALKFSTKHLQDPDTPKQIKSLLE